MALTTENEQIQKIIDANRDLVLALQKYRTDILESKVFIVAEVDGETTSVELRKAVNFPDVTLLLADELRREIEWYADPRSYDLGPEDEDSQYLVNKEKFREWLRSGKEAGLHEFEI